MLAAKFSSTGTLEWYTFLDGDSARGATQSEDGGFLFAAMAAADIPTLGGKTPLNPYAVSGDLFVVRLKPDGTF